jgi:hypothetical protein
MGHEGWGEGGGLRSERTRGCGARSKKEGKTGSRQKEGVGGFGHGGQESGGMAGAGLNVFFPVLILSLSHYLLSTLFSPLRWRSWMPTCVASWRLPSSRRRSTCRCLVLVTPALPWSPPGNRVRRAGPQGLGGGGGASAASIMLCP